MVNRTKKNKNIMDFIKKSDDDSKTLRRETGLNDFIADLANFLVEGVGRDVNVKDHGEAGEKRVKEEVRVLSIDIDRILYETGLEPIICNPTGICNDGRRVGEVFRDKYGLLRQRGFLNTTRQTVYLDFILEKANVKQLLPNTFKIETERGSLAIVPEDFLCEINYRYGVTLVNYDKCKDRSLK